MELADHATQLGKVVANLLSLEFLLRAFLYSNVSSPAGQSYGAPVESLRPGDVVPENPLTSWDTLGQLIQAYNRHMGARAPHLRVDEAIVNLRDSIAHGRVSAPVEAEHLRLLRFSNPRRGPIVVVINEQLDPSWFSDKIRWTKDELFKVAEACGATTA